mgnify:CR=1 FL=1
MPTRRDRYTFPLGVHKMKVKEVNNQPILESNPSLLLLEEGRLRYVIVNGIMFGI